MKNLYINKNIHYSFRSYCSDWFRNNLFSRKQYYYKGINSSKQSVSCGASQRVELLRVLILDPLLFLFILMI